MSRPVKLTRNIIEVIASHVRKGMTYKESAKAAGVSESTFYEWKKKGENSTCGIFSEFLEALKKAEILGMTKCLDTVHSAAAGGQTIKEVRKEEVFDKATGALIAVKVITTEKQLPPVWQASAWILERRYPDAWGRNGRRDDLEEEDPFIKWADGMREARRKYGLDKGDSSDYEEAA